MLKVSIIAFHTSTPFFLRPQSPKFDLLGAEEEYFIIFFSSSSASDSKELAMEIISLNPGFLGEPNYMKLCKNNIKLSAAVGLVKCKL